MFIYHIIPAKDWENIRNETAVTSHSLEAEGFIHCSYDHQINGVLDRYFRNAEGVVILKIDIERLNSKLVVEPSTNDENFPHVYGKINMDAVVGEEYRPIFTNRGAIN